MDDWIDVNVDQDNADDLLQGLDGKRSEEFTVTNNEADGTTVTYNVDPLQPIVLPTIENLNRFRKQVERKRQSETEEGSLHVTSGDQS